MQPEFIRPERGSSPARLLMTLLVLLPFIAARSPAQTSPEVQKILERLDRLEQENRALADEIRQLRHELAAERASAGEQPQSKPAPSVEERLEVQERRVEEQAQSKVEASQRFPIRVTGMALFNSFWNSNAGTGQEYPTVAAPGERSAGATLRQTVLGLDYRGPQTFGGGKIHGTLFMDFFAGSTQTFGNNLRFRTATLGIDWKTRGIQVGINKPIFAPREPASLAQVGISPLTGAGNLWLWIPQVRLEQDLAFGDNSGLRAQFGVVQTREVLGYKVGDYTPDLEPSRPGWEGRVELFAGNQRRIEIAPGFHYSRTHVDYYTVPSRLVSADWLFRLWPSLELTGAFFAGQNVANLGTGGIQQGFVILEDGTVRAVHSVGGWAQLAWSATPRLTFHFFSGQQDDRNSDLDRGRIGKNLAYGANAFFRIAPNVLVGLESSQFRTVYLGRGTVRNNHYDLALAYLF